MPRNAQALRWFRLATDDLKAARILVREGLHHFACFHAQQAAEKALKSFLIARRRVVPRQHHLVPLLQCCAQAGLKKRGIDRACKILDQYYLPTRYPDAIAGSLPEGLPMRSHAAEAIQLAQAVLRAIRRWLERTAEYQGVLGRLRDKDDAILSSKNLRTRLGL